ncbi:MAG: ABC-F family ATP-binding cassette domain-containing protein [Paludibacteraceae bacterium]|nr:ABC-F family ATP-binding cassette domain-containing protein [Paludibacteraceae bacterium]
MPTPYLLIEHLTKSVGSKVLFEDISFAVNEGQRIALIARNGIGKSTLLDIIAGKTDYDEGKITFRNDLKIGYLPQALAGDAPIYPDKSGTVSRTEKSPFKGDLEGRTALKYTQLLTQLGITDIDSKPFEQRSGGQQKRIALAQVLAQEPDFLMLDEPTNHLDLDMVIWLEEYLRKSRITLLLVTHDRYFLDRVCSDILELDQNQLYAYHGNYAYYLEKRAERIEAQNAETDKFRNLYRTELDWMRRMPQARAHKAQYRIDNFYEIEKKAKRSIQETDIRLQVKSSYIGNKIFEAHEVSKCFGDLHILRGFSYVFARYEKVGIIGNNGTGKSTFLRLLLGELPPDSGHFDIGSTVRFGYYRQQGLVFDEGKKVIDIVRDIAETIDLGNGGAPKEVRSIGRTIENGSASSANKSNARLTASQFLQHFLFSPSQQYDYVSKLSGGERQRLHLCTVLMRNPNFLILDEPTNDLDIPTLQVLEEYLRGFKGCLIVVSHDRYFMDRVVDHLFVFHGDGIIKDFPGNYTQWREARPSQSEFLSNSPLKGENPKSPFKGDLEGLPGVQTSRPRKLSYKEQRELAQLEQQMPQLEEEKAALEQQLSGGLTDPQAIAEASARYEEVQRALDEAELRWLELNE